MHQSAISTSSYSGGLGAFQNATLRVGPTSMIGVSAEKASQRPHTSCSMSCSL
jgi:hypothetical protein